jgi:hemerythrin-like domain-containing protein
LSATKDLKQDHITIKRVRDITQRCSERLYSGEHIPIEDIEIISVVIEEFVDAFHHGKEEKAYFPETKHKNGFSEDIRKFLIEHELGRRIAKMLLRELKAWKDKGEVGDNGSSNYDNTISKEPVARFLKSYAVFISDHTGKEDKFFDLIEEKGSISKEDQMLMEHYESCKNDVGGSIRMEQMLNLLII